MEKAFCLRQVVCGKGLIFQGDILSHLIIVKLPFPMPDPISEYEKTCYSSIDDYLNSVLIPQMLIKLKQGAGRLIRNETDTGIISILDSRAGANGKYHDAILAALPKCSITSDIQEIKQFLRLMKDKTYFE
ncbi:helicase C-terminal domain-containing protein [Anaerovirgula multivorans]|uniref:helicase C-terminal domain-containing protein n=1 Tax=Anaerovirgula multivorans TaxID=312168 RepID=UPI00113239C4|nr:helicase C-terminal domain-containing protein [Anaerovirgula multivorans]